MAHCRYCDHVVSPSAHRCPNCGEKDPAESEVGGSGYGGAIGCLVLIVLIPFLAVMRNHSEEQLKAGRERSKIDISICKFRQARNNFCNISGDSGWIYAEGPAGLQYCWNPESRFDDPKTNPDDRPYLEIQYLDENGEPHQFSTGDRTPAQAYRFVVNPAYLEKRGWHTLRLNPFLEAGPCQ
jgi:hypothetical protein